MNNLKRTLIPILGILLLAACGGGTAEPETAASGPNSPDAAGDVCGFVPARLVTEALGRDLVSDPARFDYYEGTTVSGCQWDGGKDDDGTAYFAYAAVLTPDAFTGFESAEAVGGLGDEAYAVNGADAEQVWVRVGADKVIVAAIGDRPSRAGAVALAQALLAFPAPVSGAQSGAGAQVTDAATGSNSAPAVTAVLIDVPLAGLPRTLRYAGADFMVTDGRLTNQSLVDPAQTMPDRLRVELTVEGQNVSGFKAQIVGGTLGVTFADGTAVAQVLVDPIDNNTSRIYTLSGDVPPTTQWEGAALTLSEPDREPETIALTGDATASGQSEALSPGAQVSTVNRYEEGMQFLVKDAALWLDAPQPGGYFVRAPLGQRFLSVTLEVTNTGGQNGVSVYAEQFQALADGAPAAVSYDMHGAQSVPLNTSTEVAYYFPAPAGAADFQLVVAADGSQPAQIALSRP